MYAHCKRLHPTETPRFNIVVDMPEITIPVYKVTNTEEGEMTEVYVHQR